jgi:hypothetical protein
VLIALADQNKKERRLTSRIYNSFATAFRIAFKSVDLNPRSTSQRIAIEGLTKLVIDVLHILSVPPTRSVGIKVLKSWALEALKLAAKEDYEHPSSIPSRSLTTYLRGSLKSQLNSPKNLLTFASFARGLPAPPPAEAELEYKKHQEVLLTEPEKIPDDIINSVRNFCRKSVLRAVDRLEIRDEQLEYKAKLQFSACLEKTRKDGGTYGYFREKILSGSLPTGEIQRAAFKTAGDHSPGRMKTHGLSPEYTSALVIQQAWNEFFGPTFKNQGKASSVLEAGWKTRIVTISPAAMIVLGNPINDQLLKVLSALGPTQDALRSNTPARLVKRFAKANYSRDMELYSADLSRATDYIPHQAAEAAWLGIADALKLSEKEVQLGKTILGPVELTYPDGTIITTKRGILMGRPIVWPILSLLNMWAAEHRTNIRTRGTYSVCGDDLLGLWSDHQIQRYQRNLEILNLKRNPSKELRNPNLGVFCEQHFTMSKVTKPIPGTRGTEKYQLPTGLSIVHKPRLSAILAPSISSMESKTMTEVSVIETVIKDQWRLLDKTQKREVVKYCFSRWKTTLGKLTTLGIDLGAPKILGGAGLPFGRISLATRRLALEVFVTKRISPNPRLQTLWQVSANPHHMQQAAAQAVSLAEEVLNSAPADINEGIPFSLASEQILGLTLTREAWDLRQDKRPIQLFECLEQIRDLARKEKRSASKMTPIGKLQLPTPTRIRRFPEELTEAGYVNRRYLQQTLLDLKIRGVSLSSGRKPNREQIVKATTTIKLSGAQSPPFRRQHSPPPTKDKAKREALPNWWD